MNSDKDRGLGGIRKILCGREWSIIVSKGQLSSRGEVGQDKYAFKMVVQHSKY